VKLPGVKNNYLKENVLFCINIYRFCLVELDILLFAIEVCEENGQRRLAINPDRTSRYYRIAKRTRGFFLAGSSEEASRLLSSIEIIFKNVFDDDCDWTCGGRRVYEKKVVSNRAKNKDELF
jgi:hypothetical protein